MNNYIEKARAFLEHEKIDYLLVNSTNEFLVEYNELAKNSRYYLTGFSGSTGDALVSKDNIYLFVDGRYHVQADLEVNHDDITVVKLQMGDKVLDELAKRMNEHSILGICSKKNSQYRYENLVKTLGLRNITVKLFDTDPIEEKQPQKAQILTEIPLNLTGKTKEEKIKELDLKSNEAILITNLEELSYLYNLRNFNKTNSCSIEGKAVFTQDKDYLFKDETLKDFDSFIKNCTFDTVYVDEMTVTAHDYTLLGSKASKIKWNPVTNSKCIKTKAELEHYKDAFARTDKALAETGKFIEENDNISEFDIKEELEKNFRKFGAVGQSFTSIVAKDKNSALAHYSKSSKEEIIKAGSLVLIDCGGYYAGGLATDITRVFVKGEPNKLQKTVYTTVLKAFLRAFNTTKFECGQDIDKVARDFLDENAPSGFVFNHGLGHGIGVSVHEAPPRLSNGTWDSKVPLQDNMCFTIEPGLYKQDFFGIRLENSCYLQDKKIKSFVNMHYEKKLIDFSLLDEQEKEWLSHFEVK